MPDTNTLTIPTDKIGMAKKQRDTMRNRYRAEIHKFASEYNISQFEAAHAVFDTILKAIDESSYTVAAMPNQLAQSLLASTQALIDGTEYVPPVKPKSMPVPSPHVSKMQKSHAKSTALKADKYVTDADVKPQIVFHSKSNAEAKQYIADNKNLFPEFFLVRGYRYLLANNQYLPNVTGPTSVVVGIKKSKPYVTSHMLDFFNLQVPTTGFKWRKLKGKSIHKLQDYSKTTIANAVNGAFEQIIGKHVTTGEPFTINVSKSNGLKYTYPVSIACKHIVPLTHKWLYDSVSEHYYLVEAYAF